MPGVAGSTSVMTSLLREQQWRSPGLENKASLSHKASWPEQVLSDMHGLKVLKTVDLPLPRLELLEVTRDRMRIEMESGQPP